MSLLLFLAINSSGYIKGTGEVCLWCITLLNEINKIIASYTLHVPSLEGNLINNLSKILDEIKFGGNLLKWTMFQFNCINLT